MTAGVIKPGAMLGVLGGGQLGAMFAAAARRLGYEVAVWDPDVHAPAHRTADRSFVAPFSDDAARRDFASRVRAVTYEWENVPAALCEALERDLPVRPASRVLRVIQDRIEQKTFLQSHGLPVPTFVGITDPAELMRGHRPGFPLICKTATTGYDGKGQWVVSSEQAGAEAMREMARAAQSGTRWILEERVPFERELSIIVVRAMDGEVRVYPLVENVHEAGILRRTTAPADVPPAVAAQAASVARRAVEALDGVGVLCVELFLLRDGRLLINEVAPRPHNSGHYSLEACSVSQFEQQVRALCGQPLGEVRLLSPAVMLNLIGEEVASVTTSPAAQSLLAEPGAVVHLYGKRTVRPNRKMGHVTFLAPTVAEAAAKADVWSARCRSAQV